MAGTSVRGRFALLGNGRFRLLFAATFASGLGNWLAMIALTVDVYDRTHSGWWVGELLIASILPSVFIGLLFGPLVDRLSRKGLMIASDLGRFAVFAALPFANSAAAIVVLAVIAGIGNAFFRPAVLAGLPNLVGEDSAPFFERLLERGVIVRPLSGFGAPTAIRISVGTPEEHAFLDHALGGLAAGSA